MNRMLANGLSALNVLLAVAFIGIGALVGLSRLGGLGVLIGGVGGAALAVVVCGLLAVFLDMRGELIAIRKGTDAHNDGLAALSKQLGALHQELAARPPAPNIPVFATSPPPAAASAGG